jgi:hypothetical protein
MFMLIPKKNDFDGNFMISPEQTVILTYDSYFRIRRVRNQLKTHITGRLYVEDRQHWTQQSTALEIRQSGKFGTKTYI